MTRIINLYLNGDLTQNGFNIHIENSPINGYLPPCLELITAYENWQKKLHEFELFKSNNNGGKRQLTRPIKNDPISPRDRFRQLHRQRTNETQEREQAYQKCEKDLIDKMNSWLENQSFQQVLERLKSIVHNTENLWIRLITNDLQITKFPWESWNWIESERINKKEITVTFSPRNSEIHQTVLNRRIRVLLIFGSFDSEEIQGKEEQLWKNIPGSHWIKVLKSDKRENIYQEIREHNYDIIYLSGHSTTQQNVGRFYLTNTEYLEISNLTHIIRTKKELKLLIFNSCNSLGFAFELYKQGLCIPNMIAMRYIIHNQTSIYFLQELIELFIKQGKPLHESLQSIRHFLKDNQDKYAVGSYLLPVLFQVSSQPQLWKNWFSSLPSFRELCLISGYSLVITLALILIRSVGILPPLELLAYDQLMRLKPYEKPDERILLVVATPADIKKQKEERQQPIIQIISEDARKATLSDNTLKKLLDKLKEYQPTTIGLDIYRNFPASQQLKPELEQENIIGICKKSNSEYQHQGLGLEPPREIKYFGFVDALHDHDDILRRHILTSKEDKKCKTTANFSLMLVLHYLSRKHPNVYAVYKKDQEEQEKQKEESNKSNNSCRIILGQAKFRYLKPAFKDIKKGNFLSSFLAAIFTTPGYYHNEDLRGCQIILNYRSVDPAIPRIVDKDNNQPKFKTSVPSVQRLIEIVTINQILEDKIPQSEKEKLKGRIIIVGISNNLGEQPDYWKTPYSREQIPGVFIQTQMVSQILSAALDGRALITPLLPWQDLILIFLSAFVSSLITNILMKNQAVLLIMILEVCLLSISYGLLIVGLWIPLIHLSLAVITSPVIIWIWDINFKEWQRKFNYHLIVGVKS